MKRIALTALSVATPLAWLAGVGSVLGLWIEGVVVTASASLTLGVVAVICEPLPIIIGAVHVLRHGIHLF